MFADALIERYLPCQTIEVIEYAWTHAGQPDEQDIRGRGQFSFRTGQGTLVTTMLPPRLLEEGLKQSRAEMARRIFRAMGESYTVTLSPIEGTLRDDNPRWCVEILRGVRDEPPPTALLEEFTWQGITDLFVARRRSRWRLTIPLRGTQWLPWSRERAWMHRQPVRVTGGKGALFIALQECDSASAWTAVRFECPPERPEGDESGSGA